MLCPPEDHCRSDSSWCADSLPPQVAEPLGFSALGLSLAPEELARLYCRPSGDWRGVNTPMVKPQLRGDKESVDKCPAPQIPPGVQFGRTTSRSSRGSLTGLCSSSSQ